MKRAFTALLCTLFASLSFADCTSTASVQHEYKKSEAVVIATVVSSQKVAQSWDAFDGVDYTVHIDQNVKGKHSGEITIFSEHSIDGYTLEVGKQYLLFLNSNNARWVVNRCGNSGLLTDEDSVVKTLAHMFGNY